VHQIGFIYKIIQGCTVNKTYKSSQLYFDIKMGIIVLLISMPLAMSIQSWKG